MRLFRKNRIYIFPTKMGGYLIGLLFLMFLLSVGYSNNLLLIFTLFLFGFNLLWLIQTHFHLKALRLSNIEISDAHAFESATIQIHWLKTPKGPLDWKIDLLSKDQSIQTESYIHQEHGSQGLMRISKRGLNKWKFLKVSTIQPFGLYRTWVHFELHQESFTYPKTLQDEPIQKLDLNHREGEIPQEKAGPEDIRNFAPYQGEEYRRISWKHYARSGELLIKEGEEQHSPLWIHRLKLPLGENEKEAYLSDLATKMVYCFRHQIPFLFENDTLSLGPASDETHLRECLRILSLC